MDDLQRHPAPSSAPVPERSDPVFPEGIPRPLSSLIGREAVLVDITSRLSSGHVRLLTLTGPGGVGKTRLALEAGARVHPHFRDGSAIVPLTFIDHPAKVIPAIARAIGLRRAESATLDQVVHALRHTHRLLILDNFEHVIEAAPVISELLVATPGITALVTSRAVLHLTGEHVYPIPPLAHLPATADPDVLRETEAVRLFIDRAEAVAGPLQLKDPEIVTIAAICERLEGMPLAIELAAGHAGTLSVDAILARLTERLTVLIHGPRDQPERLQTMRAAIAWGYELLSPHYQRHLRFLALLEGGFSLEFFEALLQVELRERQPEDSLGFLDQLVGQSFVRHLVTGAGISRYLILEVLREFLLRQLVEAGEREEAERIRLAAALQFATDAETHLLRAVDPAWIERLELEHATLTSALAWGFASDDPAAQAQAALLASHLWLFWYYRGHLATGRRWLERAGMVPTGLAETDRARIALGLGTLLHYLGEHQHALTTLERARGIAQRENHREMIAWTLTALGNLAEDQGDYATATGHFAAARDIFRSLGDRVNEAITLYHLGVVAFGDGDRDLATDLLTQALHLGQAADDPWSRGTALSWLGLVYFTAGEITSAARALADALDIFEPIGSEERISDVLRRAALVAHARGKTRDAIRLFAAAAAIADRIGSAPVLPEADLYDAALATLRDRPSGNFDAAWDAGRAMSIAVAIGLANRILAPSAPPAQPAASPAPPGLALSDREIEVLRLLATGETDAGIADTLFISRRTAATHIRHIYDKIGVSSRAAAAAWAVRHGIA